jgi:hypothetical protein
MHEIFVFEDSDAAHFLFGEPGVEDLDNAIADESRTKDAPVEENVRGAGEAARASAHGP